jgi:hypothetical protein
VRKKLLEAADVLLCDHGRSTQLALPLASLLREDVSALRLGSLEPVRRFPETLRSGPVGLQLGHLNLLYVARFTAGMRWQILGEGAAEAALTSFSARSS